MWSPGLPSIAAAPALPCGGGQLAWSDRGQSRSQRQGQLCVGSGSLGFRPPWVQIAALPVPTATSSWASDASSLKGRRCPPHGCGVSAPSRDQL